MSKQEAKKIYVGCSLAQAPEGFEGEIDELKGLLREEFVVLDFVGKVGGTPRDVFHHDVDCVRKADLFVAECTYPSTGLGFELGIAYKENIPTLAVAREDAGVSRLVQGIDHPLFTFRRYSQMREIVDFAREEFASLDPMEGNYE